MVVASVPKQDGAPVTRIGEKPTMSGYLTKKRTVPMGATTYGIASGSNNMGDRRGRSLGEATQTGNRNVLYTRTADATGNIT